MQPRPRKRFLNRSGRIRSAAELREINKKKSRPIRFSKNADRSRSVFVRLLVLTDRAMKLPGVSLIFAALGAVSVSGQFITLEIPHDDHNELHQPSFPSFTSKKYYFVTYFKVKNEFEKAKVHNERRNCANFFQANFFRAHQYCQFNNMELLTIDTKAEESAFLNLINNKGENESSLAVMAVKSGEAFSSSFRKPTDSNFSAFSLCRL